MNDEARLSTTPKAEIPARSGDLDQQIAAQDARIQTLAERLVGASSPRQQFSFTALHNELALEQDLAAARDERGSLLYDRSFVKASS